MLTPIKRVLAESSYELILGHSPQTLITRIVGKIYPRNPKHIHNKLQCDMCVPQMRVKKRGTERLISYMLE